MKKKIILIIQARLTSSRFPSKVIKKINNKPLIFFLNERLKKCKNVDKIVFAIPNNNKNLRLKKYLKRKNINFFSGSENNVLERYYFASKKFNAKTIIRITADCPLADYNLIDRFIKIFNKSKVDYLSNNLNYSFPHGLDVEVFSYKSLEKSYLNAKTVYEKEHVTPYIRKNNSFKKVNLFLNKDYHQIRLTVDYEKDLIVIKNILKEIKNINKFGLQEIIELYEKKKEIFFPNSIFNKKFVKDFAKEKKNWISKYYSKQVLKIN